MVKLIVEVEENYAYLATAEIRQLEHVVGVSEMPDPKPHEPGCAPDPNHPGFWICTEAGHIPGQPLEYAIVRLYSYPSYSERLQNIYPTEELAETQLKYYDHGHAVRQRVKGVDPGRWEPTTKQKAESDARWLELARDRALKMDPTIVLDIDAWIPDEAVVLQNESWDIEDIADFNHQHCKRWPVGTETKLSTLVERTSWNLAARQSAVRALLREEGAEIDD